MRTATIEWVDAVRAEGVEVAVLAPEGYRSPTVTCISLPEGRSGPEVVTAMRDRGWVIGGGYSRLKGSTIRIGHMGDHDVQVVRELLDSLGEVLR
jgi:aspartate aminotransferase-like enzyme